MKKLKSSKVKTTQDYFKIANDVTDCAKYMLKMIFDEFVPIFNKQNSVSDLPVFDSFLRS